MYRRSINALLLIMLLLTGVLGTGGHAGSALASASNELANALQWQKEADAQMSAGNYREAAALYTRAITVFEAQHFYAEVAVLRHQLGFSFVGTGDNANAIQHFEANRAYHQAQGNIEAAGNYTFYIAQAYARQNDHDRALELFEEARPSLANDPNRLAELEHWRVMSLEQVGRIRAAIRLLDEAERSLPSAAWQTHLATDSARIRALPLDNEPLISGQQLVLWLTITLVLILLAWIARRYRRFLSTAINTRRLPRSAEVKLGATERYRHLRSAAINVLLLIASAGVTLGTVEIFLRMSEDDAMNVRHLLHIPNQQVRFVPKRDIMPGVNYDESSFTTNEAGLRADPVPRPGTLRVLAVGGSSTEALFLDDQDAWPYRLQKALRTATGRDIWVANAGKSGLSSISHVVQLHYHLMELKPEIVLLLAGINDLNQCVSGGLQAIIDNAQFMQKADFMENYKHYVFSRILPEQPARAWRLLELWQHARSYNNQPNKLVTGQFNYVIQDKAGEFYVEQRRRRQAAAKQDTTPDIQTCIMAFQDNLRRIAAMAKQHGARLVLATQGSLYREDLTADEEALLWFGAVDKNPFAPEPPQLYYTAAAMAKMLAEYNAATLRVCASEQLVCLDTDAVLPKTSASYYDDVHLNIQGSHALAKAFATLLLEEAIITPAP